MLFSKLTKRAGGLILSGDYLDLRTLQFALLEVTPDISDGSDNPENLILGLAYDIRKTKEGQRDREKVISFGEKEAVYGSVRIPLLRAVLQCVFLRRLLTGYGKSDAFRLEEEMSREFQKKFCARLRDSRLHRLVDASTQKRRGLSTVDRASLLQFEGSVCEALRDVGIEFPRVFLDLVEKSLNRWRSWPGVSFTGALDFDFLFENTTRRARLEFLMELPELLSPVSPYL